MVNVCPFLFENTNNIVQHLSWWYFFGCIWSVLRFVTHEEKRTSSKNLTIILVNSAGVEFVFKYAYAVNCPKQSKNGRDVFKLARRRDLSLKDSNFHDKFGEKVERNEEWWGMSDGARIEVVSQIRKRKAIG